MHRVLWLPTPPSTGAVSMHRYWQELDRLHQRLPPASVLGATEPVEIVSALGSPPEESRVGPRLERVWQKYVAYPRLARRRARAPGVGTVHLLDHAFAHVLAGLPARVRKIATVHDLAPLRDGGDLTDSQRRRFRRTVEHLRLADVVLADSRFSAAEAVEFLSLDPDRLRVLPLGVNVDAFSRTPAAPAAWAERLAGRRVVLSIGMNVVRKNLPMLPAIFRALRANGQADQITLLRAGDWLPEPLRAELVAVLGDDGLLELGRASNADVVAAYQRADALLLPSRQEGFGFPVLEAMAAGCPVVCTNVTSLPEVGGDAALYFGPDDPDAAAAHLRALLTDQTERSRRIEAGRRQAATLTWERHYERLLAIYRDSRAGIP